MNLGKLAEHIAKFFTDLYAFFEQVKAWASEASDKLKAE